MISLVVYVVLGTFLSLIRTAGLSTAGVENRSEAVVSQHVHRQCVDVAVLCQGVAERRCFGGAVGVYLVSSAHGLVLQMHLESEALDV